MKICNIVASFKHCCNTVVFLEPQINPPKPLSPVASITEHELAKIMCSRLCEIYISGYSANASSLFLSLTSEDESSPFLLFAYKLLLRAPSGYPFFSLDICTPQLPLSAVFAFVPSSLWERWRLVLFFCLVMFAVSLLCSL